MWFAEWRDKHDLLHVSILFWILSILFHSTSEFYLCPIIVTQTRLLFAVCPPPHAIFPWSFNIHKWCYCNSAIHQCIYVQGSSVHIFLGIQVVFFLHISYKHLAISKQKIIKFCIYNAAHCLYNRYTQVIKQRYHSVH